MAKCIIDQYNNYTMKELDNMKVNGINTQVDPKEIFKIIFPPKRARTLPTLVR